jgi:hypothetical protein
MEFKELLVVVPHSSIVIPSEISMDSLSPELPRLMRNVDWYTNWLYDFRDILGNSQIEFPYCSLILEANRDPEKLEDSIPLTDSFIEPIYRHGQEPERSMREFLSQKYLFPFHSGIEETIAQGMRFMLDAHSTISSRGVTDNQIELMNYQITGHEKKTTFFCPDKFIETYADELSKRLPEIKITVNESRYDKVYGHVCGHHSINSDKRVGNKVPAILQETNQSLYLNSNGTPNINAIETLRRAFAEALGQMREKLFL